MSTLGNSLARIFMADFPRVLVITMEDVVKQVMYFVIAMEVVINKK